MAKIDVAKLGWTKVFDSFVVWPSDWEATNWAKNDKTLKKVAGADTLAASLAEGKKSHQKVVWIDFSPRTVATEIAKEEENCRNLIKGTKVVQLRGKLTSIRECCVACIRNNKKMDTKAKTIINDTKDAVEEMITAIKIETMQSRLVEVKAAWKVKKLAKQVAQAKDLTKTTKILVKKITPTLQGIAGEYKAAVAGGGLDSPLPSNERKTYRESIGDALHTLFRDMSQQVVNYSKCEDAGVDFDNFARDKADRLAKMITPYANSASGGAGLVGGKSDNDVKKLLVEATKAGKACIMILQGVSLAN